MHAHINHKGSWAFNLVVVVVEGGGVNTPPKNWWEKGYGKGAQVIGPLISRQLEVVRWSFFLH